MFNSQRQTLGHKWIHRRESSRGNPLLRRKSTEKHLDDPQNRRETVWKVCLLSWWCNGGLHVLQAWTQGSRSTSEWTEPRLWTVLLCSYMGPGSVLAQPVGGQHNRHLEFLHQHKPNKTIMEQHNAPWKDLYQETTTGKQSHNGNSSLMILYIRMKSTHLQRQIFTAHKHHLKLFTYPNYCLF